MFTKILCPLDGSDHAKQALVLATDMAKNYDASLLLMHALLRNIDLSTLREFAKVEGLARHVNPEVRRLQSASDRLGLDLGPSYEDTAVTYQPLVEIGQHILNAAKRKASHKGIKNVEKVLVDGDPADLILRCIDEQGVDCVVMGSRGLSDVKGIFLGSVSHKVMSRAPCTCIAVK